MSSSEMSSVFSENVEATGKNDDLEVDNSKSVLKKIATLYAEQLMSDLTLEVAGVQFPAHRLILSASSEVFQVMLMNREWSEWGESKIVLQETPEAAAVFPHFLKYFYTGQIRISHLTVLPVLSLADKYDIKDLVALCLSYMTQHIAQAAAAKCGQLIAWIQYTSACGHDDVAKACQNFVKWNIELVLSNSSLFEMDGETLVQLLQHNDLVVHNEITLYQLVSRWLEHQLSRLPEEYDNIEDRRLQSEALITAVLSHVRFPMMSPNQLAKLLLSPLVQDHKDFFMERMAVAMSFHSGQYSHIVEVQKTEMGKRWFTPRLYTEDIWGSVLSVDNFHSLQCYHTRTFIFSTRASVADCDLGSRDKLTEWMVDLYPKGVWFRKSLLIVWARTYDVPEVVLRTVRIAITCDTFQRTRGDENGDVRNTNLDVGIRVKVGVLVWGVKCGVEHISHVVERVHHFSPNNRVLNIDGAVDFDELNAPLYSPAAGPSTSEASSPPPPSTHRDVRCAKCTDSCEAPEPKYLLGPTRDQLKIQLVIVPLTPYCHVTAEERRQV